MLLERIGKLFDYEHQAYGHGVSTTGKMGRGIAIEFKERFPTMYSEYRALCSERKLQPGDAFLYSEKNSPYIFNLLTQDSLKGAQKEYLRKSIRQMHNHALVHDITDIAIPEIGCGLGGLHLDDLTEALYPFTMDASHHVTLYSMPPNDRMSH